MAAGFVLSCAGLLVAVSGAQAQALSDCTCVTGLSTAPNGGVIGTVSGSVYVPGSNGIVLVSSNTAISTSSEFSTGDSSLASYSIGGCSATVGAQVRVLISVVQNNICVQHVDESTAPPLVDGNGMPLIIAGGAVAAGGAAAALVFGLGGLNVSR
ncbi:hypothetical protein [Devosia enhydra]|uniref:hypothetical protein n=1 Tax=Devosia enhydra TaxID=665118 RepID=UPI0009314463|nr:hypothetical protein [Devosia enhydra]